MTNQENIGSWSTNSKKENMIDPHPSPQQKKNTFTALYNIKTCETFYQDITEWGKIFQILLWLFPKFDQSRNEKKVCL